MITRKKIPRSLGLLLAIVLVVVTTLPAFAATTGPITGTFTINDPPSVDAVTLTDTAMTPQSSYTVTVDASDSDTIDDIGNLVLKLWHDADAGIPLESEFNSATADVQDGVVEQVHVSGHPALRAGISHLHEMAVVLRGRLPALPRNIAPVVERSDRSCRVGVGHEALLDVVAPNPHVAVAALRLDPVIPAIRQVVAVDVGVVAGEAHVASVGAGPGAGSRAGR